MFIFQRLNKMRERLKEMNQWWNQVLHESEEGKHEDCGSEDNNTENNLKVSIIFSYSV